MRHERSCGAVVFKGDKAGPKVLVLRHLAGHWAFPKGHVEAGETEEMTALREIREETGLVVRLDTSFRHVNTYSPAPGIRKDVVYFVAWAQGEDLLLQQAEIESAAWLSAAEAMKRLTYPNDRKLLDMARAHITRGVEERPVQT